MKRLYILLCIIALLSSCIKEEPYHNNVNLHKTITAVIEEFGNETKTALTEDNRLTWSEGDEIKIYDGCDLWETYRLKDSDAGSSTGTFEKTDAQEGSADFYCRLVVYPADMASSVHMESANTAYSIAFDIPDKQTYVENSFANGNFPMVAIWNVNPQYPISFKNLFGAIKLQLCGSKIVKSITISGHNNEPLAGTARVGKSAYSATPAIQEISSTSTSITLDCGEKGVQLHATEPTNFIIACPPTEFTKGFKVVIVDSEGNEHIKESFKNNAITRSSILKMPVYDIEGPKGKSEEFIVFEDAVIKELCVKAFDINEDGELSYGEAALVTDLSQMTLTKKTFKTFDELKYFTSLTRIPKNYFKDIPIRSITLPESLKTIEDNAFANCSYLNSIVIPGNIGYKSFSCCTSLESVVFLEGVTSIKSHAFDGCNSLTEVAIPSNITQLENSIFYDCASLSSVSFEENGAQILPYAFFENCIKLDNVVLPSTIKEIEHGAFRGCSSLSKISIQGINTVIGNNAFKGCSALKEITILNGVKSIGEGTFKGCSSLKQIKLSGNIKNIPDYAFDGCSLLQSVVLSNNITWIGEYAFNDCSSLKEINIPLKIESIRDYAFQNCSAIQNIDLSNVNYIYEGAFNSCTSLKKVELADCLNDGVTDDDAIRPYTFQNCSSLESVTIPETLIKIGDAAFAKCSSLKEIIIPESIQTIGNSAFAYCTNIENITIPESVVTIDAYAFSGCTSLTDISIPGSVTELPDYMLLDCVNLKNILIAEGVTKTKFGTFQNCTALETISFPNTMKTLGPCIFMDCTGLKTIKVPDNVTNINSAAFFGCTSLCDIQLSSNLIYIDNSVFSGCTSLKNITLPEGISSIGKNAFHNCHILSEIKLPESVSSIGESAFWSCRALETIIIPSNVTYMGNRMFGDCQSLQTVYMKPTSVPEGDVREMFAYDPDPPQLYVPAESITAYENNLYWYKLNPQEYNY